MTNNPLVPARLEKMVNARISGKEADLIKTLRKYPFGKFVIHKANGFLIRIEIQDSRLIKEENGIDLANQ